MDEMIDAAYQDQTAPYEPVMPEAPQQEQTGETDIAGMPLDQQIDSEIIQMVTSRQQASEKWREPYRLEWDQATNHYEMVYDNRGKETWQQQMFLPLTSVHVERSVASLHNMSMGPEAPVEYKTRNNQDEGRIENTNEIVQHDLEKGDFKVHWTDFLRSTSLYGTGVGKVGYVKEEATVMVKERRKMAKIAQMLPTFASLFGMSQEEEIFRPQRMIVKDFANFKNCDIYKIYPQPHIEDFSKDTWVIEKFKITNRELVEGARNQDPFYRLDNVTPELLMSGKQAAEHDPQTEEKRLAQGDYDVPMPYLDPDLEHEGMEYWGPIPRWFLEPQLRDDEVGKYEITYAWIWVIDGRWVVRKRMNPYEDATPPYVKGNYVRRLGVFYGIGIGKVLNGLQIEKNETRNTRADNINLILNKVLAFLKDKVDGEDVKRLVSGPGALWAFRGIDDIRKALFPIEFQDITQDSWRGSAEIDREAQEATDVIKTTQTMGAGEDQAGNGTYRGQLLNRQTANERFMLYARILEIVGLNAAIKKLYSRIYQFKGYAQIEKILGEERAANFELINPVELGEIASLISLGALTTQNKGVQLAQMRDFYVVFEKAPFMKQLEYARKMYRLMGSGSDPDEVLWSDQELKMFNEAKREMLRTVGAGGMPGMGEEMGGGLPGGGPNGLQGPGGPIAGDVPPPSDGLPRPSVPARGPGAATIDGEGRPLS